MTTRKNSKDERLRRAERGNPPGGDARIEALRRQAELGNLQAAEQLYAELARRGMAPVPIWNQGPQFRAYLEEAIVALRQWNSLGGRGAIVVDSLRGQFSVKNLHWAFRRHAFMLELAFFHAAPRNPRRDDGFFAAFIQGPLEDVQSTTRSTPWRAALGPVYSACFLTNYANEDIFRVQTSNKPTYRGKLLNFLYGLDPDAPVLESGRINGSWPRDGAVQGRFDLFNLISDPIIFTRPQGWSGAAE